MNNRKVISVILLFTFAIIILLIPFKEVLLFTEQRTENPNAYYVPLGDEKEFRIRYVHSIHLTNVLEAYEVTELGEIKFVSMVYESIGIGLPGSAAEGENISFTDGLYTLTYENRIIDSFILYIATIDEELAFQYQASELNLKEKLGKGKSYNVSVAKRSLYQLWKGVDIYEKG